MTINGKCTVKDLCHEELHIFVQNQLVQMELDREKGDWEAYRYEEKLMMTVVLAHVAYARTPLEASYAHVATLRVMEGLEILAGLPHPEG